MVLPEQRSEELNPASQCFNRDFLINPARIIGFCNPAYSIYKKNYYYLEFYASFYGFLLKNFVDNLPEK
jgi:hypothetical protein